MFQRPNSIDLPLNSISLQEIGKFCFRWCPQKEPSGSKIGSILLSRLLAINGPLSKGFGLGIPKSELQLICSDEP